VLPFLPKRKIVSAIIERKGPKAPQENEITHAPAEILELVAQEMLTAIENKDAPQLAKAMKTFFTVCEMFEEEHHEEAE